LGFEFGFHGGVGFHRDWRIENHGLGFRMRMEEPWVGLSIERRPIDWWNGGLVVERLGEKGNGGFGKKKIRNDWE